MPNRRKFISNALGAGLGLASAPLVTTLFPKPALARYKAPNGFHRQDWFMPLTFDFKKDLAAANKDGKMLVLLWEQLGCTYCKQMHEVAFQYEEIVNLAIANFHFIQMDMRGDREFMDFNGKKKAESKIAKATRVTFTPTTQFFDAGKGGFFIRYEFVKDKLRKLL